jgi:hypothetical protein
LFPGDGFVLHFDPNEVVTSGGHCTVRSGVCCPDSTADHWAAFKQFSLGRVPDFRLLSIG